MAKKRAKSMLSSYSIIMLLIIGISMLVTRNFTEKEDEGRANAW